VKRRRPRTGRSRPRAGRGGQRGFTLIELMVALAISTILVMMVLSVFSRMSMAYRRQQQVASLQVILSAGQNMLAQDARPVRIVNSSTAADEIRFYSADATVQAKLDSGPWPLASVFTVDANQFINGELAVIVNVDTTTGSTAVTTASGSVTRVVPLFRACVVRILSGTANTLTLDTAAPWGDGTNSQCYEVKNAHNAVVGSGQTMFYRFRARAYRLDPTRTALGVLQLSPSGALVANDWQDLGVGFTDLQVAARMFLTSNATDPDLDGRVQYNWFSGAAMQTNTAPFTAATTGANTTFRITRLSLSLVARTDSTVDGVATAATPSFLEVGRVDNNQLGDRAAMDVSADNRIYRYTTNRLDMRNTGAGL
jgi:prepilin-type N-terminal cleavage/methylation domain-containing protein